MQTKLDQLINKGVTIFRPESVEIGEGVDPGRIDANATIHSGSRIHGKETLICRGAVIGREAPATVENCYIGPEASLNGGFYRNATFLKGAATSSAAHVRDGTIFEEYAAMAHGVGVKQTILFPFVTLGSLINFCDILMAGGTGPKHHSEVGSSYIHFNFTPQQDKATPSLVGDVPHGVMLNQEPIFLGGQGGLVGPTRLAYGTVIAAGTICRKEELRPGRLLFGGAARAGNIAYGQTAYRNIKKIVENNLNYIANLVALKNWYKLVRPAFMSDNLPKELLKGLERTLTRAIDERIKQLMKLAEKMPISAELYASSSGTKVSDRLLEQKRQFYESRNEIVSRIRNSVETDLHNPDRDRFFRALEKVIVQCGRDDYIAAIQLLEPEDAGAGTAWLRSIVDACINDWFAVIPVFKNE